jgi:general secretion pathway protein K
MNPKIRPATGCRNQRGIALLVTLSIITVLIAAALELNRKVRTAVVATATQRDRMTLNQMAVGAVHAAMAMLAKDRKETQIDSIQEDWADPEKVAEVLADLPFEKGKVAFTITDELGLIQVNALVEFPRGRRFNESQKIMWDRFIRLIIESHEAFEDLEATEIVNSLKDWLDSNDDDAITGLNGAESDYYESLETPYACRNAPLAHIGELPQVRGISSALFNGVEGMPGLGKFVTAHGMDKAKEPVDNRAFSFPGKVNINTAPLPVLVALIPSENPEYAQLIHDYREEKEEDTYLNDLASPTWYSQVAGIPGDLKIDPKLITTASDLFRIEAAASLNDTEMVITAVVRREQHKETNKWQCRVVSWQTG